MDKSKEQIQEIFNTFDKDNSGTIEKEEIKELAKSAGMDLTEQKLNKIMKVIDTNGDGKISFEEFYEYFQYGYQKQMNQIIVAKFKHLKAVKKVEKKIAQKFGNLFDKKQLEGKNIQIVNLNVGSQQMQAKSELELNVRLGQDNKQYSQSIMKNFPYIDENIVCVVIGIKCNNSDKVEEKMREFFDGSLEIAFQMMPDDLSVQFEPLKDDLKIEYKALPDELLIRFYIHNDLTETTLNSYRTISNKFLSDFTSLTLTVNLAFQAGLTDIGADPNQNIVNAIAKGFKVSVQNEGSQDIMDTGRQIFYQLIGQYYDHQKIKVLEQFTPLVLLQNARIELNFDSFDQFVNDFEIDDLEIATLNEVQQQVKEANLQELVGDVPFVSELVAILRQEAKSSMFITVITSEASATIQATGEGAGLIWEKLL